MATIDPTRRALLKKILLLSISFAIIASAVGCERQSLRRPYGFLRLGNVQEFSSSEVFLPQSRMVVRHDERGFSAMSTDCTHDLSPLSRKATPTGDVWVSSYTASSYDAKGHVLTGPAKVNLPYFKLKLDSGSYGGPHNTLYAEVGDERPEEWRLEVPGLRAPTE